MNGEKIVNYGWIMDYKKASEVMNTSEAKAVCATMSG